MYECINGSYLPVKEYNGQRVVTFKDIDTVHQRPQGTASRNFKSNRKHFIEGVDYFRRNSSEAKEEYGAIAPNGLIVVTESGYLMIVKSFTDDLAWEVQRQLVNTYFKAKTNSRESEALENRLRMLEESVTALTRIATALQLSPPAPVPAQPERISGDIVADFVRECCTPRNRVDEVSCQVLYEALLTYCHRRRAVAPTKPCFVSWLRDYYGTNDRRKFTHNGYLSNGKKTNYYTLTLTPAAKQMLGIL